MRVLVLGLLVATAARADGLVEVPTAVENPRLVPARGRWGGMRAVAAARAAGVTVTTYEGGDEWALRVRAGGKTRTVVRRAGGVYPACLDVSPAGDRVVVGVWDGEERSVVVIELATGALRVLVSPPAGRAANEVWVPCEVVLSPDGRRVAVGVQHSIGSQVYAPWTQIHDVVSGARVTRIHDEDDVGLAPVGWDRHGLVLHSREEERYFRHKD